MAVRSLDIASILQLSTRGRSRSSPAALTLASDRVTLGELIERAVQIDVRAAAARERAALISMLMALSGDSRPATGARLELDSGKERERALQAFREGRYRVIVDGRPVTDLDEVLSIGLRSRVLFVRVPPLMSG